MLHLMPQHTLIASSHAGRFFSGNCTTHLLMGALVFPVVLVLALRVYAEIIQAHYGEACFLHLIAHADSNHTDPEDFEWWDNHFLKI